MRTAGASEDQPRFHAAVPAVLFLRQVAEVLERLGIALTDHIGVGIVVKDPQQLPRVLAILGATSAGRRVVIGVVGTDVVLIGLQLLVVSLAAVGGYHRFCHTHRVRHIGNVGGILVGATEILRHLQADGVARRCKGPAQRLAEPIHFVGQIHHQRRYHSADRGCGQRGRHGKAGAAALAVGHLDDLRLHGVIHLTLRGGQVIAGAVLRLCNNAVRAAAIVGDVHTCQLVEIPVQQFRTLPLGGWLRLLRPRGGTQFHRQHTDRQHHSQQY